MIDLIAGFVLGAIVILTYRESKIFAGAWLAAFLMGYTWNEALHPMASSAIAGLLGIVAASVALGIGALIVLIYLLLTPRPANGN